jgi:hypothetical protein
MPDNLKIEELPAGPTEGGGGFRPWPPRPGIAELPVGPPWIFGPEAVTELFRLRDRVHALESQLLAGKLSGVASDGLKIPQPWRIAELPPFEALARTSFGGGEMRGPDYGWNQLVGLLQALLAALQKVPPPNPGEIKP